MAADRLETVPPADKLEGARERGMREGGFEGVRFFFILGSRALMIGKRKGDGETAAAILRTGGGGGKGCDCDCG